MVSVVLRFLCLCTVANLRPATHLIEAALTPLPLQVETNGSIKFQLLVEVVEGSLSPPVETEGLVQPRLLVEKEGSVRL